MKHEAKFSVIVPCEQFSSEQMEMFEAVAQRYGLPIVLPLRSDGHGNFVAARGLNLRDAQGLRRQISSLGYPADVVNDASEATRVSSSNPDTLVVDAIDVDFDTQDPVSEITADAWSSLEMPSLDLGLFDGSETDLDASNSNNSKDENTLSLSAMDLFKAAEANKEKEKDNATCQIDASDFKRLLEQHQKADPSGVPILDMASLDAPKSEPRSISSVMPSVPKPATAGSRPQVKSSPSGVNLAGLSLKSSIEFPTGDAPSLDIDESSLCAMSQQVTESARDKDAVPTTDKTTTPKESVAPAAQANTIPPQAQPSGAEESRVKVVQNDMSSALPPSNIARQEAQQPISFEEKRRHPVVACILVVILLLIAIVIIDIGVTPISFLDTLSSPLF